MLRYTTDRARPGLVALYDIRPGNGAGQFLQPRSPHGANSVTAQRVEKYFTNNIPKPFTRFVHINLNFKKNWVIYIEITRNEIRSMIRSQKGRAFGLKCMENENCNFLDITKIFFAENLVSFNTSFY